MKKPTLIIHVIFDSVDDLNDAVKKMPVMDFPKRKSILWKTYKCDNEIKATEEKR